MTLKVGGYEMADRNENFINTGELGRAINRRRE